MSGSILGIYKQGVPRRNDIRVGTPDPTKYHDTSQVRLEGGNRMSLAANLPGNHGFSGLRGVIIPRATELGGSRGHNPHKPSVIRIDPELIGGDGIVVDLGQINADDMAQAILEEQQAGHEDPADAMTAVFARFSSRGRVQQRQQARQATVLPSEREAPLQMPGTYVVPRASPGGGQVKTASWGDQRCLPAPSSSPQPSVHVQTVQQPLQQSQQPPQHGLPSARQQAPSLPSADQYTGTPSQDTSQRFEEQQVRTAAQPVAGFNRPLRPVTFEIPRMGEMTGYYHDVIRNEISLVLVFDHSQPTQFIWFPPMLEDEHQEPIPIAILVPGINGEPDVAYKVQTTPVRFRYRTEEFCVLLVEKEKVLERS